MCRSKQGSSIYQVEEHGHNATDGLPVKPHPHLRGGDATHGDISGSCSSFQLQHQAGGEGEEEEHP